MKKLSAICLSLVLTISLFACSQQPSAAAADTTVPATSVPATSAPAPVQTVSETVPEKQVLPTFRKTGTIEETVLYDQGNVKITARNLIYDHHGVKLSLIMENNTQQPLTFLSGTIGYCRNAVNGYMVPKGYVNEDIAPGKKASETVYFDYDYLKLLGIFQIAEIQMDFTIQDENYDTLMETGPLILHTSGYSDYRPYAETFASILPSPAAVQTFGYTVDFFTQEQLYADGGIRTVCGGIISREGEYSLFLELENTTDALIIGRLSNISINGLQLQFGTRTADAISPGMHCVSSVNLSDILSKNTADLFGIQQISSVSFDLSILDESGNDLTSPQTLTLSVPDTQPALDTSGTEIANEHGLRLVSKGLSRDDFEYSDDLHILLLAENQTGEYLTAEDVYNSLSVNGFMTDCFFYSTEVAPGQFALLDIELPSYALDDNELTFDNIQEAEIQLKISRGNAALGVITLKIPLPS